MESVVVKGCGFCVALHAFDDIRLLPLSSKKLMECAVFPGERKIYIYIKGKKKEGEERWVVRARVEERKKDERERCRR